MKSPAFVAAAAVATALAVATLLSAAHAQTPTSPRQWTAPKAGAPAPVTPSAVAAPPGVQPGATGAAIVADLPANTPPAVRERIARARERIAQRRLGNTVGVTAVSNLPLAQITGFVPEPVSPEAMRAHNAKAVAAAAAYNQELASTPTPPSSTPMPMLIRPPSPGACNTAARRFDWREHAVVSPVANQGRCGSCWAFGSVGAVESSLRRLYGRETNVSEQFVMNNASVKPNACDGGKAVRALDFLTKVGSTDDRVTPYRASMGPPRAPDEKSPYGLVSWGWVEPPSAFDQTQLVNPSRATFKRALCEHGPIVAAISADDDLKNHRGGLLEDGFLEVRTAGLNHIVMIIGWDDANDSWIIKNSWGTTWGETAGFGNERGYAHVKHGSYLLGNQAWWVHARLPRDKPIDMTRDYGTRETAAPMGGKALAALTPPKILYPTQYNVVMGHGQRVLFAADPARAAQPGAQYEVELRANAKQGSAPYGVRDRAPTDLLTRLEPGGSDGLQGHVLLPALQQHASAWHWRVRVLLKGAKQPGHWSDWSGFDLAQATPYTGPEDSDVPRTKRTNAPRWVTNGPIGTPNTVLKAPAAEPAAPAAKAEGLERKAPALVTPKW